MDYKKFTKFCFNVNKQDIQKFLNYLNYILSN